MNAQRFREAEERLWASKGVRPRERVVNLGRLGGEARVMEVGEGRPVLFIHGGNTCAASWAGLVSGLQGSRCFLLDRPGCGLSPPPVRVPTVDSLARDSAALVVDVLDGLALESADIVATSFGGFVMFHAAGAHPERVRRLVEFGWPFAESSRLPLWMRMTAFPGAGRVMAAVPANKRAARQVFKQLGHGRSLNDGRISRDDTAGMLGWMRHTDTFRNEVEMARKILSPWRGIRPSLVLSDSTLAAVAAPVLLLWGTNDPFGDESVAGEFAARLPNARLELLADAGRAPWLDDAEGCAAKVRAFLAE